MLSLHAIETGYNKPLHTPFTYRVADGELVMLIGGNGSGKSTLLHTISGMLPPLNGEIQLNGDSLASMPMIERAQKISMVSTAKPNVAFMSGFDLVLMGRFPHNQFAYAHSSDIDLVHQTFDEMGIGHLKERWIRQCSDGELQLLCIAQAIVQQTPVMLLDEITAHLDILNTSKVMELLLRWHAEKSVSTIMATHDLRIVQKYADTVFLFKNGSIEVLKNVQAYDLSALEQFIVDRTV